MKALAKVANDETGECWVALGTDEKFYQEQGFSELDVEQAYNGVWYLSGHAPARPVELARKEKHAEINDAYESAVSVLVAKYPATERLTFDRQEAEARAWLADGSAETPLVDAIADGRGMDKAELVRRIIARADAFAVVTGCLTGQRQKYEDALDAAATAEDVEAVTPEFVMPEGLFL